MRRLSGQLAGTVFSLYAMQGLNYLMPVLMLPFLLRALGPRAYGSIVFAQSLMGFAVILIEFGFNFTAARDISIARDDPYKVAKIYWTTMAAKVLLLATSIALLCGAVLLTSLKQDWPVIAASSLLLVGNVVFPQWYFQGLERLKDFAITQVIAKCVISGSVILLVRSPQDTWIAALILSAPQLVGALIAATLGKSLFPTSWYRPTIADVKRALAQSWHLFAASASTTLYLHVNAILLGIMCGEKAVALYGVGNRIIGALQGLATPITQAVFPRASQLFDSQRRHAWEFVKRVLWILLPLFIVISALTAVFAPLIVKLIAGPEYADAVSILRILSPLPVLVTLAVVLSQIVMVNVGLARYLPRIYLVIGTANLAMLPFLIGGFAADGAAWSLVIAETIGPLLMLMAIWRKRSEVGYGSWKTPQSIQ